MRNYGTLHPTDLCPVIPDTVGNAVLAAGAGQAFPWPTQSTAALATIGIMRVSAMSTLGVPMGAYFNGISTGAVLPTTAESGTTVSSGNNIPILGVREFQMTTGSTGFSIIAPIAGYATFEYWHK